MAKFIVIRLFQLIPTLLGISIIVFVLMRMIGDPTSLLLPPEASEEQRQQYREAYGFDRPLIVQYFDYLLGLLRGDWGNSLVYNESALSLVLGRVPATLQLSLGAILIVIPVGFAAGIIAAVKRNSIGDWLITAGVFLGQSVATFWLGILLIMIFAVELGILPVSGRGDGSIQYMILPAITLAASMTAIVARITRSGMLEVMEQEFVRTARSKGLRESTTLFRHIWPNTLIPVITVLGIQITNLIGGSIVTESVFQWPGVGTLVLDSIYRRDYPVVQAAVLLLAMAAVLVNLIVDILYGYLDPRVRIR